VRPGQPHDLYLQAKNLINTDTLAAVNRVVTTDALGNPTSALLFNGSEYPLSGKSGYDQRLIQLGLKFAF
jgi:hypothetical protein